MLSVLVKGWLLERLVARLVVISSTGHVSGRAVLAGAITGAVGGAWGAWLKIKGF